MLFTWAFPCVGLPRMEGLLAALPEVRLPGLGCWCPFRDLRFSASFLYGGAVESLVSGIAVRVVLLTSSLPLGMDFSLVPGRCLSVGARWGSSGHPTYVFFFLNALCVLASASTRRFWIFHARFSVALLRERGWVVLCFRPGLGDDVLWYLPCSSVRGLHCTGPTNGRLLYPVRAAWCSWSAWAAPRQRCAPLLLLQFVT